MQEALTGEARLLHAKSADEAVALVEREAPDLVIVGYHFDEVAWRIS